MAPDVQSVGYIGLGVMGGALARRLLTARVLTVFDLNAEAVAGLVEAGATPAESAADLAARCDVVFLCLPKSEHVEAVLFGAGGLAGQLREGSVVVDQTSGDPEVTRSLAERLAERGIGMVDAPVSGGAKGAAAGTITIMTGGAEADLAKVRPILEQISPNIFACGEIGAGQVMKLINNTISLCNRFAMLEGVALGMRNGLDLSVMADVLNSGGAKSKASENMLPGLVKGEPNSFFQMALMLKDLNLASGLAVSCGVPMQFGQLARGMLQAATHAYGEDANLFEISDYVARESGTSFRPISDDLSTRDIKKN